MLKFIRLTIVLAVTLAKVNMRADSTSAWRIGGMIDTYAQHTVDAGRVENLFNIELAMADIRYTTVDVRARVALQAGNYVGRNYGSATPFEPSFVEILHAAFVGIRLGDALWVDVGVMPSHIGNETAISSENITYTRSLIAETSPYFETGAKVSLQINKELYVAVLALNGWQNIYDYDNETSFGSLVILEPGSGWRMGWSTFIGAAAVFQSQTITTRYFSDLYASYSTGDFAVAAAFDVGKQELPIGSRDAQTETVQAIWFGGTLQARWNLDSILRLNARIETYQDPENVMKRSLGRAQFDPYIPYEVLGASVGLDVLPSKYTLLRFEGRMLHSPREIFLARGSLFTEEFKSTDVWVTAALTLTIP